MTKIQKVHDLLQRYGVFGLVQCALWHLLGLLQIHVSRQMYYTIALSE